MEGKYAVRRRPPSRRPRLGIVVALMVIGLVPIAASAQTADPVALVRDRLQVLVDGGGIDDASVTRVEDLLDKVEAATTPMQLRTAAHRAEAVAGRLGEPGQLNLRRALDDLAEYLRLRSVFGDDWACVEYAEGSGSTSVDAYYQPEEVDAVVAMLSRRPTVTTGVIGLSNRGRPIRTVRIGEGDRVVFLQAGIHANEPTGTTALIDLLVDLSNNSARSQEVREALTIVGVPMLNPDGAVPEYYQRANDQTWPETVAMFPQLPTTPRAFYHSLTGGGFWSGSRVPGYDVNRDFNPDFGYVPQASHLPGSAGVRGMYLTPEARASRDLYAALEAEFGLVDVFVDLHNQAPCNTYNHDGIAATPNRYTPMSISAQMLSNPAAHGAGTTYPKWDWDASRRANVAAWLGTQKAGSPYANVTRYPQNLNLAGSAVAAYQLRGSAGVLMEAGRQRHSNPEWRHEFVAKVHELAMRGIIDSLVDGSFYTIDPNLYQSIPIRN